MEANGTWGMANLDPRDPRGMTDRINVEIH